MVTNLLYIVTGHKQLKWLFNCKDPGSRLVRWRLKLEDADALSRFPVNLIQPVDEPIPSTSNPNLIYRA